MSTLLAPMQDVSTLPLWKAMHQHGGGPDIYVTEYFRVHPDSKPEPKILRSVTDHDLGKPVIAQMIGNLPEHLARTALVLEEAGADGIDVNLGCPAPRVCGKNAGGAILKNHDLIRSIAETLRPVVRGKLSLKTRVGFESPDEFADLLDLFADLPIDSLAIHGRTVRERYQSDVHTDEIANAVAQLPYPVYANGSVVSVATAEGMLDRTRAAGLMVGRGAIRNPWLFPQIAAASRGDNTIPQPNLSDLHNYVFTLYDEIASSAGIDYFEKGHVHRMKKFMNYIASGISGGQFTHQIRRANTASEFKEICDHHLIQDPTATLPTNPEADGKLFCGFEALSPSR